MTWSEIAVVVVLVLGLLVWSVWVAASRLDRLHRKVGASRSVVEAQLVRRATAAAALATSGLLDPVSSVLVGEAAWAALGAEGTSGGTDGPPELLALLLSDPRGSADRALSSPAASGDEEERGQVESELSATLREVLGAPDEVATVSAEPGGVELLDALSSAWYRAEIARRFHNEAVLQTQRVRRGRFVRLLRLAGHAPEPRTLELDDAWPSALPRPGVG
ncbi:MAG: hypothetical protein NVV70_05240 [Cellulomonas sp.]|uniref:Membrane protein n=1 Tax=Cellulomonas gelida TaxID=1712 RepID=A0A4Y3KLL4_9CELL|nr:MULTISPECIES: hypothetical protein [Cellulomonas]KMM45330.1 hypothetical protein CWIS_11305 [Cellulomonas sp. A375-1]MCR6647561.1 hypothetical protein [Cellulomonas sp.]MCR6703551.1 hypothetical protein [Cellulomonas sp.]GEA84274.1 membrane protein [Cellulomonas gelida]GGL36542.1 membrane protein [Cellulomonas gelida]